MWKDAKYLLAYASPAAGFLGLWLQGAWAPGSFYIAFVIIPLMELISKGSDQNLSADEETEKAGSVFFDILLYLNAPILYGALAYFFYLAAFTTLSTPELIGSIVNVGILVGTLGINVGHELGHRVKTFEQTLAKILLLPALYMHFFIEHNRGHHKNVATDDDPASARRGETVYGFWIKSISGSYWHAWQLETRRLEQAGQSFWSLHNQMLVFQVVQLVYLAIIGLLFGSLTVVYALAVALVGVLLLESVNYIEHYGLRRKILPNGRYEPVNPRHSWNSDHDLGRIFLYELTRHSDHHYKASRKYQVLRHWDESPQLPVGYPGAIVLSLAPPLWFALMDKRVEKLSHRLPVQTEN